MLRLINRLIRVVKLKSLTISGVISFNSTSACTGHVTDFRSQPAKMHSSIIQQ